MNDIISIIVPVYNVEKYLNECIESLVIQTYKNIEIILVEDGSPDKCSDICENWKKKDSRIKVIHKKNGGLSDARNAGLQIVSGTYICFVDSDDYIDKCYIEKLYKLAYDNNVDIVQCGYYQVNNSKKILSSNVHKTKSLKTYKEMILEFNTDYLPENVVVWNKIYKTYLFKDLTFPKGKINEDQYITYKLFYLAKKIFVINEPLYYYRYNSESIMGKKFNLKRLDIIDGLKERVSFFKDVDDELYNESIIFLLNNIIFLNMQIKKNYKKEKKYSEKMKKIFKEYYSLLIKKNTKFKTRCKFLLFSFMPDILNLILEEKNRA